MFACWIIYSFCLSIRSSIVPLILKYHNWAAKHVQIIKAHCLFKFHFLQHSVLFLSLFLLLSVWLNIFCEVHLNGTWHPHQRTCLLRSTPDWTINSFEGFREHYIEFCLSKLNTFQFSVKKWQLWALFRATSTVNIATRTALTAKTPSPHNFEKECGLFQPHCLAGH